MNATRVINRIQNDEAEWKQSKRLAQTNKKLKSDTTTIEIQTLKNKIGALTEENFLLKGKLDAFEAEPTKPKIRYKIRDPIIQPKLEKIPGLDSEEKEELRELDREIDLYLNDG